MMANPPLEITVEEARNAIKELQPTVIDVREAWEVQIAALPNTLHIPLVQLPEKAHELPKDELYLTLCHHGMRSLQACHFMRQFGFTKVASIKGGIHQWSLTIDAAVPCY